MDEDADNKNPDTDHSEKLKEGSIENDFWIEEREAEITMRKRRAEDGSDQERQPALKVT